MSLTYEMFKKKMVKEATKRNVPLIGEFELTGRCNFGCTFCYLGSHPKTDDLSTKEWKDIFKAAVDNGMLYALLTGGEFLLRKDFSELYQFLFDFGVRITLYTNGFLITQSVIEVLKQRPPELVGITLYGSNNQVYEKVTRVKNAFDRVSENIDMLRNANINVAIRTIPIPLIIDNLDEIINYAKSKNILMAYSLYLSPSRDNPDEGISERLSARELLLFEYKIRKAFNITRGTDFEVSENGSLCVAFRSAFFINYRGEMQPCALLNHPSRKVEVSRFLEIFKELSTELRAVEVSSSCGSCELKNHCMQCYARRYLEGHPHGCSPYLREHASLRKEESYDEV